MKLMNSNPTSNNNTQWPQSIKIKIKSSLYSPYYAEACNELRGPSPRHSAWATQLRRNVATVASRWRHCADLTGPGIEPQTSRTESERFATELTATKHKLSINQPGNLINQSVYVFYHDTTFYHYAKEKQQKRSEERGPCMEVTMVSVHKIKIKQDEKIHSSNYFKVWGRTKKNTMLLFQDDPCS